MLVAALVTALMLIFWPRSSALFAQLDQAEERIKKDVNDEERRKQALAIVQKMKAAEKDDADARKKTVDTLTDLLNKRDSTVAEIEAAARPLDEQDLVASEKYLDGRFELTKVLTATEWTEVFAVPGPSPTQKIGEATEGQKP
jgi:hypothetical protein